MRSAAPTPVIAATARRPVAVLVGLAAVVLAVLAVRYSGVAGPGALEAGVGSQMVEQLAHHRGVLLLAVVPLGHPTTVVAAALLLAVISLGLRRPRVAAVALLGPPLTGAAADSLKPLIGRTLEGGDALPSGHTAGATALAIVGVLIVVSITGRRRPFVAVLGSMAVVGVASAMAVALVVNHLHYVTDTIAGFCAAVAVVLGLALIVDGTAARLSSRGGSRVDRRDEQG